MNTIRLSPILGPELYGRVVWFGRLRWLAVSGLTLVSVASRIGEGSTFTVRLPLQHTPPESERMTHAGTAPHRGRDGDTHAGSALPN